MTIREGFVGRATGHAARGAALALGLLLGSTPGRLAAQQRLPLGGRTASMGGAAAAAGRDAAMPFVNPAGFGRVPHHTLSLSASLYRQRELEIERYFFHGNVDPELGALVGDPTVVAPGLTSSSFEGFPGALSVLWHLGGGDDGNDTERPHHVLSASVLLPRHEHDAFEGDFALVFDGATTWRQTFTLVSRTSEYLLGPGYALRLGSLQLGLSAFLAYRTAVRSSEDAIVVSAPNAFLEQDYTGYAESYALGFAPVIGAQLQLTDALSVGLAVAPETLPLTSEATSQERTRSAGPDTGPGSNFVQATRGEGEIEVIQPTRLRAGVSWEQKKAFALALDAELELGRAGASRQSLEVTTATQEQGAAAEVTQQRERLEADRVLAVNLYLGAEYYPSPVIALRLGGFYEPSPLPELRARIDDALRKRVDRFGVTTGVGFESDVGETTIGLALGLGSGETIAPDAFANAGSQQFARSDVRELSATLFVSGTVDLEELAGLVQLVTDPEKAFGRSRTALRLGELEPSLARFERNPVIDVLVRRPESYLLTGQPDYDRFFELVARIRATVAVTRALLVETRTRFAAVRERVAQLGDDAEPWLRHWLSESRAGRASGGPGAPPAVEGYAELVELFEALTALERAITSIGRDLTHVPADARRLVDAAARDFRSTRAAVLPAVANNLAIAQADVVEVAGQLPELLRELSELLALVTAAQAPASPAPGSGRAAEPAAAPTPVAPAPAPEPAPAPVTPPIAPRRSP